MHLCAQHVILTLLIFTKGAKLVIEGVEMDVFLLATVIRYPNATLDVELTLKACFGSRDAQEELTDPTENCTLVQQILRSGPIKGSFDNWKPVRYPFFF